MPQQQTKGIILVSFLILFHALWGIKLIINANWYYEIFSFLPPRILALRYLISWAERIFLIIAAIGIWNHREILRKFTSILLILKIISLPWKHPKQAILNNILYHGQNPLDLDRIMAGIGLQISWADFSVTALIAWDLIFFSAILYYLNKPEIKKLFH